MTDKIITTFETTITWYRPRDMIPPMDSKILIKLKNTKLICLASSEKGKRFGFDDEYVDWWCPLPEFE